jgi:hypothetical protein
MTIWIGTRKGAFALRSDSRRRTWKLSGPQFLGHVIITSSRIHASRGCC